MMQGAQQLSINSTTQQLPQQMTSPQATLPPPSAIAQSQQMMINTSQTMYNGDPMNMQNQSKPSVSLLRFFD
jgi:hypothetical protein